jgi:hypothetical protein
MLIGDWMTDGIYLMNDPVRFCKEEEIFFGKLAFIRMCLQDCEFGALKVGIIE